MLDFDKILEIVENGNYEKSSFVGDCLSIFFNEGGILSITKKKVKKPQFYNFLGSEYNYYFKIEFKIPGYFKTIESWKVEESDTDYNKIDLIFLKKYHEYKIEESNKYFKYFPVEAQSPQRDTLIRKDEYKNN